MSERPKGAADPDATVMLPTSGLGDRAHDDDATVMMPADRGDDDATVMMPAPRIDEAVATAMTPAAPVDEDATVMIPAARGDDDATVMMPAVVADEPDPEATIAIPTPGRRREADAPALPAAVNMPAGIEAGELGGLNPLVAAANPVLGIAAHIRHALKHSDPLGLRADLNRSMDAFEASARGAGVRDDVISAASVALCALVDESVGSTPWGTSWKTGGLLLARHGERAGGEIVGSSRVDLQACKLEYSIVSPK